MSKLWCKVSLRFLVGLIVLSNHAVANSDITIQKWRLTSGKALRIEIKDEKLSITELSNRAGVGPRQMGEVKLNSVDWTELMEQAKGAFSDEMFGQKRRGGMLDGIRFKFYVRAGNEKQGVEPKAFSLDNVRFAELDAFMKLLDSYLPDKYRLEYATKFGPAVDLTPSNR